MPLIWKFQNPEASIFEEYFEITAYEKDAVENGVLYQFEIEGNHNHEYFFQVNKPTLSERLICKSGYEAAFWYEIVGEDDMEFDPATKSYKRKQFERNYDLIPLDLLKELSEYFDETTNPHTVVPEQSAIVPISTEADILKKHFRISSYKEDREELQKFNGTIYVFKVENDSREFRLCVLLPSQNDAWPDKSVIGFTSTDEKGIKKDEFIPLSLARDLAIFFTEKQKHDNR